MAEKPISTPLPADLPTNWRTGQTVSPTGTEVGLTQQHGYNYQSQQINNAQTAINTINEAFENVYGVGDTIPVSDGGTGANNYNDSRNNLGASSQRNILRNWYFVGGGTPGKFPINRNGLTTYTTNNAVSVDGWTLSNINQVSGGSCQITSSGLRIGYSSGNFLRLTQYFDNEISGDVTLSVLVGSSSSNCSFRGYATLSSGGTLSLGSESLAGGQTLVTGTANAAAGISNIFIQVNSNLDVGNVFCEILAVKLELGAVQTLAHQDADGNWVLNDVPSYAEQYAICEQYSPIDGSFVGSQHSNPNLFDNWHFVGGGSQQGGGQFPINQRGQTSYTGIGYGIDRWKIVNSDSALSITNAGMTIANSTTSGDGIICVGEFIEPSQITIGAVYTVSVLVSGTSGNGQWSASPSFVDPSSVGDFVLSGAGLFSATFIAGPPINQDNWYFYFWKTAANTEDSITIQAVKLELGPVQTLAHQDAEGNWVLNDPPPNFQQELAKCQRYYLKAVSGQYYPGCMFTSTNGMFLIPTPVQMRSTPAFSLVSGATLRCYDGTRVMITASNIIMEGCDATGIKIALLGIQGAKEGSASFTDGILEFSADL